MRHQHSLLHQLLQFVPWDRFDRLVEHYGADARVRRLSTKSLLVAQTAPPRLRQAPPAIDPTRTAFRSRSRRAPQ
ncbi:MAG: DUF4372 domain-containing protein [Proteobacteria bacterium]|nr:DUF4372 domain-containing protein [Pseudomonadota bacterium]